MLKKFAVALVMLAVPVVAHASLIVDVDALSNSSSGGVGVATLTLTAGQHFTSSVDAGDLWNAGALPRWSNADGLTGALYATGSDDSGQATGTLIGQDFGLWTEDGLSAPYGALVGEIGGVFKVLGTHFDGVAWATGTLYLFYWDSNNGDNTQFVTATLDTAVPEPATLALIGSGLVGLGLLRRRKKKLV